MITKFDYTKLIIENLNKIVPVIILLITSLGALSGITLSNNSEMTVMNDAMKDQITVLTTYIKDNTKPIPVKKINTTGSSCANICQALIDKHKRGKLH